MVAASDRDVSASVPSAKAKMATSSRASNSNSARAVETEPSEARTITPYLAAEFPDELPDASVSVSTLSVERTFWER
jgi:hypothetical protein